MSVWLRVGAGTVKDFELGSRSGEGRRVLVESVLTQEAGASAASFVRVRPLRARPAAPRGSGLGSGWPGMQAGAQHGATRLAG